METWVLLCLHRNIFLILGSFFFFVHFSRIYLFLVDWWAVSNGKVNNELLANCFGRNLERETDLWIFCFFLYWVWHTFLRWRLTVRPVVVGCLVLTWLLEQCQVFLFNTQECFFYVTILSLLGCSELWRFSFPSVQRFNVEEASLPFAGWGAQAGPNLLCGPIDYGGVLTLLIRCTVLHCWLKAAFFSF